MKKIILTGLLSSFVILIVGFALSFFSGIIFPQLTAGYNNTTIFRPWSDPKTSLFFVSPFFTGFIMAVIWDKVKTLFGNPPFKNGIIFGLIYWSLSFPEMIINYSSYQIYLLMVVSWWVMILIQGLCAGLVCSFLNK